MPDSAWAEYRERRRQRAAYEPEATELAPGLPWVRGPVYEKAGSRLRVDCVLDGVKPIASRVVKIFPDGREALYNYTPARPRGQKTFLRTTISRQNLRSPTRPAAACPDRGRPIL